MTALPPPVLAAFVMGGCTLVATLLGLVVPAVLKHGKQLETVRSQVENDHGTNLRDDLDFIRDVLLETRTDIAWVRREQLDQARRLTLLEND